MVIFIHVQHQEIFIIPFIKSWVFQKVIQVSDLRFCQLQHYIHVASCQ